MKGLIPPSPTLPLCLLNSSQPSVDGPFQDRCPLFCEYRVPCPFASQSSAVRPLQSKCVCPSPGSLKQMGIQASENDSEGKKTIRRIERAVLRQAESGGRRKTKARQNVPATSSQSSPAKGQVAGFQNCADTFSNCSVPSLVCLLSTSQDHV